MLDQDRPAKSLAELASDCLALLTGDLSPAHRREVWQLLLELYTDARECVRLAPAERIPDELVGWAASELRRCASEPDPFAAAKELLDELGKDKQPAKRGRGRPESENDGHIAAALFVRDLVKKGSAIRTACEAVAEKGCPVITGRGKFAWNKVHPKTLKKKYRVLFGKVER